MALTRTEFCTISHKQGDKSVKKILKAIKIAEDKNKKLFQIKPKRYFVDIVYSNKEYDKKTNLVGIKAPREGYALKDRIIIISPEVKDLLFDLNSLFYHEINHIFYTNLVGNYNPVWFSEGMATYLMRTYKFNTNNWKKFFRSIKKPESFLYHRYIKKRYYKNLNEFYTLSYLVYRYLNKKYSKKIIIRLLKEFSKKPSKSSFDSLLIKYFKQTKKEIVQKAIH